MIIKPWFTHLKEAIKITGRLNQVQPDYVWYINGLLLPEIDLVRHKNYTFGKLTHLNACNQSTLVLEYFSCIKRFHVGSQQQKTYHLLSSSSKWVMMMKKSTLTMSNLQMRVFSFFWERHRRKPWNISFSERIMRLLSLYMVCTYIM